MTSLRGYGPAKIRGVLISQEAFLNSLCSDMVPCIQFSEASICRTLMYYFLAGYPTVFVTKLLRCGHCEGATLLG